MDNTEILIGSLLLAVICVIAILAWYITGWAAIYLAHIFIGAQYYTAFTTRTLVGLAMTLAFGGVTSEIIKGVSNVVKSDDDNVVKI